MLERYTHPTQPRKLDVLDTFTAGESGQNMGRTDNTDARKSSGPQGARTLDLRVANARKGKA